MKQRIGLILNAFLIFAFLTTAGIARPLAQADLPPEPDVDTPVARDAQGWPLASLPLLDASSMEYLGMFNVPEQDGNGVSLTYGGNGLSYDPAHNGLFIGCHDYTQYLAEVSVPVLTNPPQTAALLQNCADVTEGRLPLVDDYLPRMGGSFLYNGRLLITAYGDYDADLSQATSHFVSTPDLDLAGDIAGPFTVGSGLPAAVSGYMGTIPAEWQSTLGGPALTGQCCINIVSRSSSGPAVSVFDPNDVGVANPVPATEVLFYPVEHPLAAAESQNNLFNLTTRMGGVAFPAGSRSVLFIGAHGTGPFCYGTVEECGDDPVQPYHGPHAYPYVFQVWAYDALDLLAVKNGTMESWEVQPYALWQLNDMAAPGHATISGAFYDSTSGRLYITEKYGEEPHVHVYKITVNSDVTPPETVSITRTDPNPTAAISVDFTVTFSAPVTGVTLDDFSLTTSGVSGATVSGVAGSGSVYTLTVNTGSGNGTIRLDLLDDDTILDADLNPLGGAGAGNGDFNGGETYDIVKGVELFAPSNGEDTHTNRPAFQWNAYAGATNYQIQISTSDNFSSNVTKATLAGSVTTYTPKKDLLRNATYYWRVAAKVGGVYGPWSETWSFTTGNPPTVPKLRLPGNKKTVAGPSPLFDWKDSTVPIGVIFGHYDIQISADANFTAFESGAPAISQYDGFFLTPGTYYWRVRAVADNGDFSAWSTVRIVIIQ